jgi:receptor-type tyrosine-protein phosphatase gamma
LLEPYTEYKIWLKAFTWKNEGEPSEAIRHRTDISGPSAPRILNLTCQSHDTLYLQWQRPQEYFGVIDRYIILYRDERSTDFEEVVVSALADHPEPSVSRKHTIGKHSDSDCMCSYVLFIFDTNHFC